jgi:phenylpropionate dioxygenase-like ring-hydroxylating dioxygenase large terminal subunit
MVVANGEVEVIDGVQKNVISCNWKIAVDNLFDWYHVMYSHASANSSGFVNLGQIKYNEQFVMLGEYGHAISGPGASAEMQARLDTLDDEQRRALQATMPAGPRIRPQAATDLMGPIGVRSQGHPNIFPNLWVTLGGMQLCLRLPRGPQQTELWWFTMAPKNAPPEMKQMAVRQAVHLFGPAGLLEQDDGENWSQSTRASMGVASRKLGHTLQMGIGQDEAKVGPNGQQYVETQVNEHGQRWLYRSWAEWLAARDWNELKANHSAVPEGTI